MKTLKIFLFNLVMSLALTGCPGEDEISEAANAQVNTPENTESHVVDNTESNDADSLNNDANPSDPAPAEDAVPTDTPEFKPLFASPAEFQKVLKDNKCNKFLNINEEEALKLPFGAFGIAREDNAFWNNKCNFLAAKDLNADDIIGKTKPWQGVELPIKFLSRLFASKEVLEKVLAENNCKEFLNISEEEALKLPFGAFGIARDDNVGYDNRCLFVSAEDLKAVNAKLGRKVGPKDSDISLPITYLSPEFSATPEEPANP